MRIELEIDDSIAEKIKEAGLKPEAFRRPKVGDTFYFNGVEKACLDFTETACLILAPLYTPDEWLRAEYAGRWVYLHYCCGWHITDIEPRPADNGFRAAVLAKFAVSMDTIATLRNLPFTPPPADSGVTKFQI
jgi:hypothetical protein